MSGTDMQPYNPADDEFDEIEAAGFDPTDPEQVRAYRRQAQAARDDVAIDRYLDYLEDTAW